MIIYNIKQIGDRNLKSPIRCIEHLNALRLDEGVTDDPVLKKFKLPSVTGVVIGVREKGTQGRWIDPYTREAIVYQTESVR